MAGGLMQLVAYGAQDVYLTGNPEVTFFQAKYKRHTNFAMENIEQTVNGTAATPVASPSPSPVTVISSVTCTSSSSPNARLPTAAADCNWVAERAV